MSIAKRIAIILAAVGVLAGGTAAATATTHATAAVPATHFYG